MPQICPRTKRSSLIEIGSAHINVMRRELAVPEARANHGLKRVENKFPIQFLAQKVSRFLQSHLMVVNLFAAKIHRFSWHIFKFMARFCAPMHKIGNLLEYI